MQVCKPLISSSLCLSLPTDPAHPRLSPTPSFSFSSSLWLPHYSHRVVTRKENEAKNRESDGIRDGKQEGKWKKNRRTDALPRIWLFFPLITWIFLDYINTWAFLYVSLSWDLHLGLLFIYYMDFVWFLSLLLLLPDIWIILWIFLLIPWKCIVYFFFYSCL